MKYIITVIATASMLIGAPEKKKAPEKPAIERPAPKPHFPRHWGKPPQIQLRDYVKLPGRFGFGSSTLAKWIANNIKKDTKPGIKPKPIRPKRPEPSVDVKEKIAIVIAKEKEMNKIRSHFRESLKETKHMTKEKREELIKSFKEANAAKHQALKVAQKELQQKIRETKQEGDRRQ
jgi:hypothetical protein